MTQHSVVRRERRCRSRLSVVNSTSCRADPSSSASTGPCASMPCSRTRTRRIDGSLSRCSHATGANLSRAPRCLSAIRTRSSCPAPTPKPSVRSTPSRGVTTRRSTACCTVSKRSRVRRSRFAAALSRSRSATARVESTASSAPQRHSLCSSSHSRSTELRCPLVLRTACSARPCAARSWPRPTNPKWTSSSVLSAVSR